MNCLAGASIHVPRLLALALEFQCGIFLETQFLHNFVSATQDDGQAVSAAAATADQYPVRWPPRPRLCHVPRVPALRCPPSQGAEGLDSRLPHGDLAIPKRRRKNADEMCFAHNCLSGNGCGRKHKKQM